MEATRARPARSRALTPFGGTEATTRRSALAPFVRAGTREVMLPDGSRQVAGWHRPGPAAAPGPLGGPGPGRVVPRGMVGLPGPGDVPAVRRPERRPVAWRAGREAPRAGRVDVGPAQRSAARGRALDAGALRPGQRVLL